MACNLDGNSQVLCFLSGECLVQPTCQCHALLFRSIESKQTSLNGQESGQAVHTSVSRSWQLDVIKNDKLPVFKTAGLAEWSNAMVLSLFCFVTIIHQDAQVRTLQPATFFLFCIFFFFFWFVVPTSASHTCHTLSSCTRNTGRS